jgi:ubiquinone/menaquinone biosynthesis C-methylase UbiE
MTTSADKRQIASAYNAAVDRSTNPAVAHRDYFGRRAVEFASLKPGEYVLDVCSGTGSSAIPAAREVGSSGRVIGVDLADSAVSRARERAAEEALGNVEFRVADFDQVYFRTASFDAVICVFGVFFMPDMPASIGKMWRLLRGGGRLAIVTRGADVFEPANTIFWEAVRAERPELYKAFAPWERLTTPELVREVFAKAGIAEEVVIDHEDPGHELESSEAFWELVMGTGYRATVDRLTEEERERVRAACLAVEARRLTSPVMYVVARKT